MKTTPLEYLKNNKSNFKKPKLIIAIDPDVTKSGLTELDTDDRSINCYSLTFPVLIEFLQNYNKKSEAGLDLIVVVEAGWLNLSNWHTDRAESTAYNAKIGNSTGRNHQVGILIVEMCHHYGIEVVEQRPLKKIWKGAKGKISHEELKSFVHNLPNRTSQDIRDSVLIAWNHAGYPIRLNSKINGKEKK